MDGLDEDRGVTTGPDAHSIAALLPHDPPAGMRVVVAGRPDPPIPDDVPCWHRLRGPGIVRPLAPSAYAQDIKTLTQRELRSLLRGTPAAAMISQAATVARSITNPDRQAHALAEVAGALTKAGQHEQAAAMASQAATVAHSITSPGEQVQALTVVARALAQAGQHEQAVSVARSITNRGEQPRALAEVAGALVATGSTRQAYHAVAVACAVGQWTTVLELVLSLEPSALSLDPPANSGRSFLV